MNPPEMIILIVLIVTGAGVFKTYFKQKERLSTKQTMADTEELEMRLMNQERTIQSLKKRVETLESIVVRDEYELDRKFREL